MFENVSFKIKSISKVLCILLIIVVIIGTFVVAIGWGGLYVEDGGKLVNNNYHREHRYYDHNPKNEILPYMVIFYGACICFGIYFSSLILYGFGQLIENTSSPKFQQKEEQKKMNKNNSTTVLKDFFSTYANDATQNKQEKKPLDTTYNQREEKSLDTSGEKDLFIDEIETTDSMVEIWKIWRKYSLDVKHPSVDEYIRQLKDKEQLHGKAEDYQEIKKKIKEML